MIKRFEQFTAAISSIHRFIQKIERDEMEKYGLNGACAQYLLAMAAHPEGITASELSEICNKDKAAVSRILNEMEAKGLVIRDSGSDTQYRVRLTLTETGKQAADFVNQKAALAAELVGKGLSPEDRKAFYTSLALIAANIEALSNQGIPD